MDLVVFNAVLWMSPPSGQYLRVGLTDGRCCSWLCCLFFSFLVVVLLSRVCLLISLNLPAFTPLLGNWQWMCPLEIYADHCHGAGHRFLSFVLFGKWPVALDHVHLWHIRYLELTASDPFKLSLLTCLEMLGLVGFNPDTRQSDKALFYVARTL